MNYICSVIKTKGYCFSGFAFKIQLMILGWDTKDNIKGNENVRY